MITFESLIINKYNNFILFKSLFYYIPIQSTPNKNFYIIGCLKCKNYFGIKLKIGFVLDST